MKSLAEIIRNIAMVAYEELPGKNVQLASHCIVAKAKDADDVDVVNVNYAKCRRKQETEETQRKCASKDGL